MTLFSIYFESGETINSMFDPYNTGFNPSKKKFAIWNKTCDVLHILFLIQRAWLIAFSKIYFIHCFLLHFEKGNKIIRQHQERQVLDSYFKPSYRFQKILFLFIGLLFILNSGYDSIQYCNRQKFEFSDQKIVLKQLLFQEQNVMFYQSSPEINPSKNEVCNL